MALTDQVTRIKNLIAKSYTSVKNKKGTIPTTQNIANLPAAIDSIILGSGNATDADVRKGKTYSNDSGASTGSMPDGSATTPATTKQQSQPTFSKSGNVITATVAATSVDVTPTISAGYITSGTKGTITMSSNSNTYTIPTQTKTATSNGTTIYPDSGYYLTSVAISIPVYSDLS